MLPMKAGGDIDWDDLRTYLRWIADQRPAAICMNMDASEGHALSEDEQVEVARVSLEAIDGDCPFFSGLIAAGTRLAVNLGMRLKQAGCEGLVIFPPLPLFLGQPVADEMVVEYHQAVAEEVGLPIVAFQFRKGLGPDYSAKLLGMMAGIEKLIALKEASHDIHQTASTIKNNAALPKPLGILTGSDAFIFEAMMGGSDGALIGFAATATQDLVEMHNAVARGDYSTGKAIWDRLGPLARFSWRPPIRSYRPRMKQILVFQGLIKSAAVRSPLQQIDAAEQNELRELARDAGLI
jgi:4-hydroxy-tetrahydrodipicolinate synthase